MYVGVPYNSFRFVSICFVSFRFDLFRFVSICFVSFRFVSFRFDLFRFVPFRFCFVSHFTGTHRFSLYSSSLSIRDIPDTENRGKEKVVNGKVNWLFNVTINDISVIYVTATRKNSYNIS